MALEVAMDIALELAVEIRKRRRIFVANLPA